MIILELFFAKVQNLPHCQNTEEGKQEVAQMKLKNEGFEKMLKNLKIKVVNLI